MYICDERAAGPKPHVIANVGGKGWNRPQSMSFGSERNHRCEKNYEGSFGGMEPGMSINFKDCIAWAVRSLN